MDVLHSEPVRNADDGSQLRIGVASWDEGEGAVSIKYAWRTSDGRVARGGEVPITALPQMLAFAIRHGYITL